MSFNIYYTSWFAKELKHLFKKYPSIKDDLYQLVKQLEIKPETGTPIGNNCYKIRMAIKSKRAGKSAGARVITFVQITKNDIYLVAVYDKSEIASLSEAEISNRLKHL